VSVHLLAELRHSPTGCDHQGGPPAWRRARSPTWPPDRTDHRAAICRAGCVRRTAGIHLRRGRETVRACAARWNNRASPRLPSPHGPAAAGVRLTCRRRPWEQLSERRFKAARSRTSAGDPSRNRRPRRRGSPAAGIAGHGVLQEPARSPGWRCAREREPCWPTGVRGGDTASPRTPSPSPASRRPRRASRSSPPAWAIPRSSFLTAG